MPEALPRRTWPEVCSSLLHVLEAPIVPDPAMTQSFTEPVGPLLLMRAREVSWNNLERESTPASPAHWGIRPIDARGIELIFGGTALVRILGALALALGIALILQFVIGRGRRP